MQEPKYILDAGTKIVTDKMLGSTAGIMVRAQYLEARRPNARGTIKNWVAGHGGDIYWVEHEDGSIAVYGWMEFEYDRERMPTIWDRVGVIEEDPSPAQGEGPLAAQHRSSPSK